MAISWGETNTRTTFSRLTCDGNWSARSRCHRSSTLVARCRTWRTIRCSPRRTKATVPKCPLAPGRSNMHSDCHVPSVSAAIAIFHRTYVMRRTKTSQHIYVQNIWKQGKYHSLKVRKWELAIRFRSRTFVLFTTSKSHWGKLYSSVFYLWVTLIYKKTEYSLSVRFEHWLYRKRYIDWIEEFYHSHADCLVPIQFRRSHELPNFNLLLIQMTDHVSLLSTALYT